MENEQKQNKFVQLIKKRWFLILAIIYLIAPVDLIPDVIPIFGKVDDATLLLVDLVRSYIGLQKSNETTQS